MQKIKENTRQSYWTGTIATKYGTRYTFDNDDILKGSIALMIAGVFAAFCVGRFILMFLLAML